MSEKLGLNAVLASVDAIPTPTAYTVISNVTDVELELSKEEADATTRASGGWKKTRGVLKDAPLSFEMNTDPSDTNGYAAFVAAWIANTLVKLAVMDGPVDGTANSEGWLGEFDVIGLGQAQPLNGVQRSKLSLKPAGALAKHNVWLIIADPGDAGAIPVTTSGTMSMTSIAPETRTLAAPTVVGQRLIIALGVDGGDVTLTCATEFNATGDNTAVFADAGDTLSLQAETVGENIRWRVLENDGVVLSTV